MALIDIKVPDIGDFAEVTVIELMVKAGDTINRERAGLRLDQPVAGIAGQRKVESTPAEGYLPTHLQTHPKLR